MAVATATVGCAATAGVAITVCGRSGMAVSSARSERISSLCPASTLSLFWMDCVESIA